MIDSASASQSKFKNVVTRSSIASTVIRGAISLQPLDQLRASSARGRYLRMYRSIGVFTAFCIAASSSVALCACYIPDIHQHLSGSPVSDRWLTTWYTYGSGILIRAGCCRFHFDLSSGSSLRKPLILHNFRFSSGSHRGVKSAAYELMNGTPDRLTDSFSLVQFVVARISNWTHRDT